MMTTLHHVICSTRLVKVVVKCDGTNAFSLARCVPLSAVSVVFRGELHPFHSSELTYSQNNKS